MKLTASERNVDEDQDPHYCVECVLETAQDCGKSLPWLASAQLSVHELVALVKSLVCMKDHQYYKCHLELHVFKISKL